MTLAIYALNNYLWKMLQVERGWDADDYGGKIPIMPGAEAVEFDEFDLPFIVYGWALEGAPSDVFALNAEDVGYNIYSDSLTIIDDILGLINQAFRTKDEAASNINRWMNSSGNSLSSQFAGINFTSIEVVSITSGTPPTAEGGKSNGFIILRYQYTVGVNAFDYRYA